MSTEPSLPITPPIRRHPAPVARVRRLLSLTFERPDPDRAVRFFADFGLSVVGREGGGVRLAGVDGRPLVEVERGPRPTLLGFTFEADEDALAALALTEGCTIELDRDGRRRISLRDPIGWQVNVVALDADETPVETSGETAFQNGETVETHRAVNRPLRLDARPPDILHLGHVALEVVDFDAAVAWYTRVLGLLPSDIQVLDDGSAGLVFLRCDRGAQPTEHHTLVLARSIDDGLSHAAFAVRGLDALAMGQRLLRERGWTHAWGIGRHLMGSQLFDYWRDPWGAMMEHYADSDMLDATHIPDVMPMTRTAMAQWGPPMPADFVDTRLTPRKLLVVLRNLLTRPALTLGRVLQLKRTMNP